MINKATPIGRIEAITALTDKWATRQFGQHAGYLDAPEVVDLVMSAIAATPLNAVDQQAEGVPDGVSEALQRLIENSAVLGAASQADALLVAKHRRALMAAAQPASTQAIAEALIRLDGIYRSLIDDEYAPQPPWLRDALQLAGQAQPSPEVSTQAVVTDAEEIRKLCRLYLDAEFGKYDARSVFTKIYSVASRNPSTALPAGWDAKDIKQPGWHHVAAGFVDGAREARANPTATDDDFKRAADGYSKRVFEDVDPESERRLRTGDFGLPVPGYAERRAIAEKLLTPDLIEAEDAVGGVVAAGALVSHPDVGHFFGIIDPDYARIFTKARILAWQYGYACVMHGSFTRDLDLLLVPWEDRAAASTVQPIINMLCEDCDLTIQHGCPEEKAHGRKTWTLLLPGFGERRWVDFSVMRTLAAIKSQTPEAAAMSAPTGQEKS